MMKRQKSTISHCKLQRSEGIASDCLLISAQKLILQHHKSGTNVERSKVDKNLKELREQNGDKTYNSQ